MDTSKLAEQLARTGTAAPKVEIVRKAGSPDEAITSLGKAGYPRTAAKVHDLLDAPVVQPDDTPLPDDFPAREILVANGMATVGDVRAALESGTDLTEHDGIGHATAQAIADALT